MEYTVHNLEEMQKLADLFVKEYLNDFKKVFFYGQMGAGKTTFIKMLCASLGVRDATSSPTFSLVNSYRIPNSDININHADLYRIKDSEEAFNAGIYELMSDEDYFFVEWPEKIETFSAGKLLKVIFDVDDEEIRHIKAVAE